MIGGALRAILALCRPYWRQIVIVVAVVAGVWWVIAQIHDYGARQFQAGRNEVIAADADAREQAAADQRARDAEATHAATALHAALDISLPKLEVTTHAATTAIRTLYLAQPATSVCVRPAGVQDELDAAVRRANAAASGQL